MFYLTAHSTDFILWLFGVEHTIKDHLDNEREKPASATTSASLSDKQQGILYICYGLCYGALAGMRNRSMGPP